MLYSPDVPRDLNPKPFVDVSEPPFKLPAFNPKQASDELVVAILARCTDRSEMVGDSAACSSERT